MTTNCHVMELQSVLNGWSWVRVIFGCCWCWCQGRHRSCCVIIFTIAAVVVSFTLVVAANSRMLLMHIASCCFSFCKHSYCYYCCCLCECSCYSSWSCLCFCCRRLKNQNKAITNTRQGTKYWLSEKWEES